MVRQYVLLPLIDELSQILSTGKHDAGDRLEDLLKEPANGVSELWHWTLR